MDELGITLPQMNSIMLSGLEGAQRVRGANPPKTKPTPVTIVEPEARPVWKPKRKPRSPKGEDTGSSGDTGQDGQSPPNPEGATS